MMLEIQNVRSRILDTPLALLAAIKHSTTHYMNIISMIYHISQGEEPQFSFSFNMKQYQSQEVCKATKTK